MRLISKTKQRRRLNNVSLFDKGLHDRAPLKLTTCVEESRKKIICELIILRPPHILISTIVAGSNEDWTGKRKQ